MRIVKVINVIVMEDCKMSACEIVIVLMIALAIFVLVNNMWCLQLFAGWFSAVLALFGWFGSVLRLMLFQIDSTTIFLAAAWKSACVLFVVAVVCFNVTTQCRLCRESARVRPTCWHCVHIRIVKELTICHSGIDKVSLLNARSWCELSSRTVERRSQCILQCDMRNFFVCALRVRVAFESRRYWELCDI